MSKTKRAYKFRFYPTDEQKRILAQTFGCVRFVYNFDLHMEDDLPLDVREWVCPECGV